MPIRVRLALSFAAVTLVLVAVGGLLFAHSFRGGVESSLEPGLRTQASALRASIRRGDVPSRVGADGAPTVLRSRDTVAQVLDPDGRLIATTSEAGRRSLMTRSLVRRAARHETFTKVEVGAEREPYRVRVGPVSTAAGPRVVVTATSLEATNAAVDRVDTGVVVGGAIAVAVAGVGGWLLARAALRPVERLRREAAEISERDLTSRLPVPTTRDEIAALASTINVLLADLQTALSRQRAFVADAGHELRTPLAVLRTELELAGRPRRTQAQLEDAVHHAAAEADRLTRLAEDLLFLAHRDDPSDARFERVALLPTIERAVSPARPRAARRDVRVTLDGDPEVHARVDPDLLRRAVDNLLDNALRYSPPGGTIAVRVQRNGLTASIEVADDGPGFPPEFLPHAFARFRRADDARSRDDGGTGLGLAIVLAVARTHGGTAQATNRPVGGAVVTIRIPVEM